ncbi:DUF4367 domain-containing protein [Litchfieldia salsa]|uniref:DUF4367 domain-containing protein n=1 Tax=Litchfieldia salsa TaxID=930152 RepID=A0A1H0PKZ1_9BACI|nr:DUF4367 domain-containing protein [Litchfieldia salsa]SDP05693.1 protein of unknown function [Litchfieldia salsa]
MSFKVYFISAIMLVVICFPANIDAREIKYNHDSLTIEEIQEKVSFMVLVPEEFPESWTLEIKTYPDSNVVKTFSLHYMDANDEFLQVGIEQRGSIDPFRSYNGMDDLIINKQPAYFQAWENEPLGGILCWKQDGTYIEMTSHRITKEEMIEIARSIK